jgi:hypothetical protein
MGNFLHGEENLKPQNKSFIRRLKKLQLFAVHDIFKDYVANYLLVKALDAEQFDDLFSPLLNNTTPIFEIL